MTVDWIDQRLFPEQGLKMGKDKSKNRDAKKAGNWPERRHIGIPELKDMVIIDLVPGSTRQLRRLQSIAGLRLAKKSTI